MISINLEGDGLGEVALPLLYKGNIKLYKVKLVIEDYNLEENVCTLQIGNAFINNKGLSSLELTGEYYRIVQEGK
ncbi:hypothetical protein NVP1101O_037 [Vibrio phage 1.101.O._10N.261.45.C6]|nr:hypothetical protein NVP1101O_037 [Vibrio phage 1.101.O._10N.261.45.C6]